MKMNEILEPVIQEAQAVVNKYPTGQAAMENGPLPHDELVEYNRNCRVLHIAQEVAKTTGETTEIPDEEIDGIRRNVRGFAFSGANLFASPGYQEWLSSLSK